MLRCGCAYGDVVFCELVVKVVYADLASVAMKRLALLSPSKSLYTALLVGCTPGWRSPVVRLFIVVATTATACAVFFVAIVYPVAGSRSALVQFTIISNNLTRQYRISHRVCSVSPEVGVSSCSRSCPSFEVRRRWSISQARVAWSDAPELEDVARERGSYGSRRRELRHLLLVSHCFCHAPRPSYIPYLSDTVSGAFVSVTVSARSSGRRRGASVGSASTATTVATAALLEG